MGYLFCAKCAQRRWDDEQTYEDEMTLLTKGPLVAENCLCDSCNAAININILLENQRCFPRKLQQEQVEVLFWSSSESFKTAASDTFKRIVAPPSRAAAKQSETIFGLRFG